MAIGFRVWDGSTRLTYRGCYQGLGLRFKV